MTPRVDRGSRFNRPQREPAAVTSWCCSKIAAKMEPQRRCRVEPDGWRDFVHGITVFFQPPLRFEQPLMLPRFPSSRPAAAS